MANESATDRAKMPATHNPILERRSVENGNRNLLKYLKPGLSVLDVGCGSGAITRSIAEKVGPTGRVLGIDLSPAMIELTQPHKQAFAWLEFQQADVYSYATAERFDLVTSARTLQWLTQPEQALLTMKRWLKPGGILAILDYNHEKIVWNPAPPASMRRFYNAFLEWRQDAGFDNAIADHLAGMMHQIGLEQIHVEAHFELTQRPDPSFPVASRLWSEVAEIRGPQLVQAGYVTEAERLQAITEYDQWIATEGEFMEVYLLAVEGCL